MAVIDGAVVGVLAAFPVAEGDALARRFIRLTLGRIPPWRLPGLIRHLRASVGRLAAAAGGRALRRRPRRRPRLPPPRRGARAARRGRPHRGGAGLRGVALDTGIENRAARALYERSGFEQRGLRPAPDERTARAIGGSGFVGYVKRR